MEDNAYQKLNDEQISRAIQDLHEKVDEFHEKADDDIRTSLNQETKEMREEILTQMETIRRDLQKLEKNAGHLQARQNKVKLVQAAFRKEEKRFAEDCKSMQNKISIHKREQVQENKRKSNVFDSGYGEEQQITQEQYAEATLTRQLLEERNEDLQYIDAETQKLQRVVADLAQETDKQGEYLDIVQTHQVKVKDNLINANLELDEAQTQQSSANKKYCILLMIVLMLLGIGVAAYFLFMR